MYTCFMWERQEVLIPEAVVPEVVIPVGMDPVHIVILANIVSKQQKLTNAKKNIGMFAKVNRS